MVDSVTMEMGAIGALVAAGAYYYMSSRPKPFTPPLDLNHQSKDIGDGARMSTMSRDGKAPQYRMENVQTLHEAFKLGIKVSGNGRCLGTRGGPSNEYQWIKYQEVYDRAQRFGSGLIHLGHKPNPETFIGIYSQNRTEWVVTEQACSMYSMVVIPLYNTLGAESSQHIINLTELTTVVCDKYEKAKEILDYAHKTPSLKRIIVMNPFDNKNTATKHNVELLSFDSVIKLGASNLLDPKPAKPDDLCTICFTSGTTGLPKGVMLTHSSIVNNIASVAYHYKTCHPLTTEDCHLSYMPLAHVFERGMHIMSFMHGCHIGFFQGDVKKLLDDMQTLKPTLFNTVPRLLNRIYDKVFENVKGSAFKTFLLKLALSQKEAEIKRGIFRKDSIWDRLIFGKVQNFLGGRVKSIICGSAPLLSEIRNFTCCALGCILMEGYGQTEISVGIMFNIPGDTDPGHVGTPLPGVQVKVIDIPEKNYYSSEGKGEICARGPGVFLGYYKDPEKTAEALDEDGWLHTGDIGHWQPNGTMKIIDRKKNIFKLSQGEYIAPEKIENVYMTSPYVAQVFVHGNSFKTCTMAVVVPDEEVLMKWAAENAVTGSFANLCQSQNVKSIIYKDVFSIGKTGKLSSLEQVKDIHISSELFSMDNGLLTPTFKNKRVTLLKKFEEEIDRMYKKFESQFS